MTEQTPEPGESVPAWAAALQSKVDALASTVAGLVPTSHAQAQRRTEDRLDRPSSVEEATRREVERLDRARRDDEERAASAKHRGETDSRLAKLEQKERRPAASGQAAAAGEGGAQRDWRSNLWR